jgi:hypothetical protein
MQKVTADDRETRSLDLITGNIARLCNLFLVPPGEIYASGELPRKGTLRKIGTVQAEGQRQVRYEPVADRREIPMSIRV